MLNQNILALGKKRSTIREIFEFGNQRAKLVGRENIFDFSLGNPNVPAPDSVQHAIRDIINTKHPSAIHGYTSAPGNEECRAAIAESLNARFGTDYSAKNLYLTLGAAASISLCFKALTASPADEFIVFAPFFPEYQVFIEHGAGAKCVVISAQVQDFQINFEEFERKLNPHTKGVVINSPNNPTGVVYSAETISRLSALLTTKSEEYGHPIFLISDEPYREIIFDGIEVPFIAPKYKNTLVCYSYSKSLSLPGERIGYVLVPNTVDDFGDVYAAICGAGRVLGYVCAPALFQQVIAHCAADIADISIYEKNRNILLEALTSMGYKCVKPEGAFYLFPKTLEENDRAFCERAKKYDLLLVPGADFGAPGHMRIAYCVQTETVQRALPLFEKLAKEYGL
ncbi:Aspartate aminotransferase [Sporomusa ovata DSM 2662]|uniref:Aminotransferase n=1 Tax=Sporomusa ovata TaxID=2378 RepID=A0A0U1L1V5_9FIRM|nr:pyridoxal phosphate-dependent aminotransferase [Sporomusa ovata]EQB25101.1 putative aspartate aminotransferase YhdR [Sporomusa ovata DSM 2662]CQR73652.1 Biosynthetic Aromatic amino acid aminotransferase alpha @ Aspartate aminotransferase [Sporomusa ovata]